MENNFYLLFLFILGSSIGSFLNVYRFRYPKSISIIYPSSFCPKCNKNIPWLFNVPIISWVLLKGKCCFCKSRIPFSYPLIEFITALLFTLNGFSISQFSPNYLVNLSGLALFTSILIAVFLVDFDNYVIPNELLIFGSILGLIFNFLNRKIYFDENFISIVYKYFFLSIFFLICFELLNLMISLIINKDAFGFGDSKFLFMICTWLGFKGTLATFILSLYVGGVICIFLILLRFIKRSGKIPFGPFLSISAYLVALLGSENVISFFKNIYWL